MANDIKRSDNDATTATTGLIALIEQTLKQQDVASALSKPLEVISKGNEIILPEAMSYDAAIAAIQKKKHEEEQAVGVYEVVDAFPLDGAQAFTKALKQMFGWATAKSSFWTGITFVDVEVDFGKHEKVLWSEFEVPGINGSLGPSVDMVNGRPCFVITGNVQKKFYPKVVELAELTRKIAREQSIYKGKPIRLVTDVNGKLDVMKPPSFLDLSNVREDELIFADEVMEQVTVNLFTPIRATRVCREQGIPLKRGVLVEGPYGVGKTLTANVTAKVAYENGWTFVYLDRVEGLRDALSFAQRYQPAVVFAEDIDRIIAGGRSLKVDDVLNIIDGVDTKHAEVITILTTNHVERIEKAMLRPGRLDAVITLEAPDAKAVQKLIKVYARGTLAENTDLTGAGVELAGQIPATIREVVERSKLYAISHMGSAAEPLRITGEAIVGSSRLMKKHLDLLAPKVERQVSAEERLGQALAEVVRTQPVTDVQTKPIVDHMQRAFGFRRAAE